jgi:hypothetical protein
VVAHRPRYLQAKIGLRTQIAGVLHGRLQVDCFSFGTWMSKPLLNDPLALFSNKALVQGAPFDAGSLGHLPVAPTAEVRRVPHMRTNFYRKINSFFRLMNPAVDPSAI